MSIISNPAIFFFIYLSSFKLCDAYDALAWYKREYDDALMFFDPPDVECEEYRNYRFLMALDAALEPVMMDYDRRIDCLELVDKKGMIRYLRENSEAYDVPAHVAEFVDWNEFFHIYIESNEFVQEMTYIAEIEFEFNGLRHVFYLKKSD